MFTHAHACVNETIGRHGAMGSEDVFQQGLSNFEMEISVVWHHTRTIQQVRVKAICICSIGGVVVVRQSFLVSINTFRFVPRS